MLFARTGSVGAMQPPTTKDSKNEKFFVRAHTISDEISHMSVMPGPRTMSRGRHCWRRYLGGSCRPVRKTCKQRTRREKLRLICESHRSSSAYLLGRIKPAPWRENAVPIRRHITATGQRHPAANRGCRMSLWTAAAMLRDLQGSDMKSLSFTKYETDPSNSPKTPNTPHTT